MLFNDRRVLGFGVEVHVFTDEGYVLTSDKNVMTGELYKLTCECFVLIGEV